MSVQPIKTEGSWLKDLQEAAANNPLKMPSPIHIGSKYPSRFSISPLLNGTVKTMGHIIDSTIQSTFFPIMGLLGSYCAFTAYKAAEHGAQCAIFSAVRNLIFENKGVLSKILWNNRSWSDYIPFVGAFKAKNLSDLFSLKDSVLPKVAKVFIDNASNIHELEQIINDDEFRSVYIQFLQKSNLLPENYKTLPIADLVRSYLDSITQDRSGAQCNYFQASANIAAMIGATLLSLIILKTTYEITSYGVQHLYKKYIG